MKPSTEIILDEKFWANVHLENADERKMRASKNEKKAVAESTRYFWFERCRFYVIVDRPAQTNFYFRWLIL